MEEEKEGKKIENMTVGGSTRREDRCCGWGRQREGWVEAGGEGEEKDDYGRRRVGKGNRGKTKACQKQVQ